MRPAEVRREARLVPGRACAWGCWALALALHLFQGGEAAHRSLGLLQPANASAIRAIARLLAVLIGGGFVVVTLTLALPGGGA